jgi:hypothetical protein
MKVFTQSATLLFALASVLIIITTPLVDYQIPILAFLIIISVIFVIIRQRTKRGEETFVGSNKEVFMVTAILLLAIFLTGGISSNLYFLLYFLLFGLVFLFEPPTVFVLLLGLIVVFFPSLSEGDLFSNLIKLGSLVFLSPISYFFGREFQKRDKLVDEVRDKTGQIIEDADTLRSRESDEDLIDEIDDIKEQAKDLRRKSHGK